MRRSIGVTLAAVVVLLGSAVTLLTGLLIVVVALFAGRAASPPPLGGKGLFVLTSFVLIVPAALGIATGIGTILLKRWARISILIFAGFLALMGLLTPVFFLMMPMPTVPGQNPGIWTYTKIAISVFYLFLAAIGVWWLILFNLKATKEQFAGGQAASDPSERPLSITIIGWLLILGVLSITVTLSMHLPGILFGYTFTGWSAVLWYLIFAGIGLYAGVGLLRLDPRGRQVAICYLTFGALNGALFYLLPGYSQRMATVMNSMPAGFRPRPDQPMPMLNPWFFAVLISVFLFVQLYFLIREKAAFYKAPTPDSPLATGIS